MLHFFCQLLGIKLKFKTLKFFTECFNFNKVFLEDFFFFPRALHKGSLIKYDLLQFFYLSSFCIFIKVHIFHILSNRIRRGISANRH